MPQATVVRGTDQLLDGILPAAAVHELEQLLPGLTRGEGVVDSEFAHYATVPGPAPERPRTDDDPLRRTDYLLRVERRAAGSP